MKKPVTMCFSLLMCFGLAALDFPDYDAGKGLPEDKVYPQGRIFPYSGFQPADVKEIRNKGFTMAGPAYGTNRNVMLETAAGLDFPVIYTICGEENGEPLTAKRLNDPAFKPDWKQLEANIAGQVKEAAAKYPNIAWWYLTPEELRFWRKNEYQYLQTAYRVIRETDPLKRPVWLYLPNHYNLTALKKYVGCNEIIGKGAYANYSNMALSRGWIRWSAENQVSALEGSSGGKFSICVPEMFQNPPGGKNDRIEAWARHDVYLSLACGARGVVIFSLARRKTMNDDVHRLYYDAYSRIASELTGKEGLGQVFLFGRRCNDLKGESAGSEELALSLGASGKEKFKCPPVMMTELLYRRARYLVTVNSAEKPVSYRISGITGSVKVNDIWAETFLIPVDGAVTLQFKPLEVKVLKITAEAGL